MPGVLHWQRLQFFWVTDEIFSLTLACRRLEVEPGQAHTVADVETLQLLSQSKTKSYLALICDQLALAVPVSNYRRTAELLHFKQQQVKHRAAPPNRELVVNFANRSGLVPPIVGVAPDGTESAVVELRHSSVYGRYVCFTKHGANDKVENHKYFVYNKDWVERPSTRFLQRDMREHTEKSATIEKEWLAALRARFEADSMSDIEFDAKANNRNLEALIERGVDVNLPVPESGLTALHYAALCVDTVVLRILINSKELDYLARDAQGNLPLDMIPPLARGADVAVARRFLFKESLRQADRQGVAEEFMQRHTSKFDPKTPPEPGV